MLMKVALWGGRKVKPTRIFPGTSVLTNEEPWLAAAAAFQLHPPKLVPPYTGQRDVPLPRRTVLPAPSGYALEGSGLACGIRTVGS